MKSDKREMFREDFALLVEAGFIAVKQLDEISASRIFHAAQMINPESVIPQIGLGYIAINKLEVKTATKIFEDVVNKDPENHLAQTMLGICFLLNKPKRKKGEKLIRETLGKTTDPTVKSLGELSLVWADKDLQKELSPFFTAKLATQQDPEEPETEPLST
jgi:hypothetical protein